MKKVLEKSLGAFANMDLLLIMVFLPRVRLVFYASMKITGIWVWTVTYKRLKLSTSSLSDPLFSNFYFIHGVNGWNNLTQLKIKFSSKT